MNPPAPPVKGNEGNGTFARKCDEPSGCANEHILPMQRRAAYSFKERGVIVLIRAYEILHCKRSKPARQTTMRVKILDGEMLIGQAELTNLDPPMGVAMGVFIPAATYNPDEHANVLDGEYVGDRGLRLRVLSDSHGEIERQGVAILDSPSLNEIEVHVLGVPYPLYETLFGDKAGYRSYWGSGAT